MLELAMRSVRCNKRRRGILQRGEALPQIFMISTFRIMPKATQSGWEEGHCA